MGNFEVIGAAESTAVLAEAQAIGQQITLTHRDTTPADLYALILDQSLSGETVRLGQRVEVGNLTVMIPVQTGFAVMIDQERPITAGDTIEYPKDSDRLFQVTSAEIAQRSNGYVYVAQCREQKTKTTGTGG